MINLSPEQEERKQHIIEAIQSIPTVKGFKVPAGFPVPLGNNLLAKIIPNSGPMVTEGGILLVDSLASNQVIPNTAVIYAIGPNCSELLNLGHKIIYNPYANNEVMIGGVAYLLMAEFPDVIGILPPEAWHLPPIKKEATLRREERIGDMSGYRKRKAAKDENDKDKSTEKAKKK